jgi:hypothetical protein
MLTEASFDIGGLWWKICAVTKRFPEVPLAVGAGLKSLRENRRKVTADLFTALRSGRDDNSSGNET